MRPDPTRRRTRAERAEQPTLEPVDVEQPLGEKAGGREEGEDEETRV